MTNSYRILSIEACDIYKQEQANGKGVGLKLPQKNSDAYFELFLNKLDYCLDLIELKRVYEQICGEPFSLSDKFGNEYTLAVINVKFKFVYTPKTGEPVNTKALREHYYKTGFNVDGIHYVRYKRSAGSSRQGKCLFIDERLYAAMASWGECGLTAQNDLASWEAYKALSLSSIKGIVNIPIEGILFVPDYKSKFHDEVVSVELRDGNLIAETKTAEIINDIWDGESLLDESLFAGNYSTKHMMLLRNKFFKSCAFRTKLKKWIKDKGITLDHLKSRKCVTLATDISQIVMVTTPNSLKYLKFVGGLSQENVRRWSDHVDSIFGLVKCDKRTRYFDGRMVLSSYQLLNTLGLTAEQADSLLRDSKEYIKTIRNDIDFMRFHFSNVCAKEGDYNEDSDDEESGNSDGLADRADVLFGLMNINNDFQRTELYNDFRDDMVENQKSRLLAGRVLVSGINATLFGNGPELLKYIAGEEIVSDLTHGQIRCSKFGNGQKLLCARSPHVTMGNLYCVENNLDGDIWNYFDLGDNIVCVNAIDENIQQRLNGCDYDSDTVLITDDSMLIETAEKYMHLFKVPVCNISSSGATNFTLAELDHNTNENKIGQIVNLSQRLNSIIWDRLHRGEDIADIYSDVCKLAVLSGLEIDKAKRAYDNIRVGSELACIQRKNNYLPPQFFKVIDDKRDNKYGGKKKDYNKDGKKTKKEERNRGYAEYDTAMEYIYKSASTLDFRDGKAKRAKYVPVADMLTVGRSKSSLDYMVVDQIIEICNSYKRMIARLRTRTRKSDTDERDVIYDRICDLKVERDNKVADCITNENVLYLVIQHYEKNKIRAWNLYVPILNSEMFKRILKDSKEKLATIKEDPSGDCSLYGFRYSKK